MLTVLLAAVVPIEFSIPVQAKFPPPTILTVLLLMVTFALTPACPQIPLNLPAWLDADPLLLLMVLYETLAPHWLFILIPPASLPPPPPKLKMLFPVAAVGPPISFPKSPSAGFTPPPVAAIPENITP